MIIILTLRRDIAVSDCEHGYTNKVESIQVLIIESSFAIVRQQTGFSNRKFKLPNN